MKFLLDEGVSRSAALGLREAGHDVARVVERSQGVSDVLILELALSEQRVIVTEDDDFGQLIVHRKYASCGVIRLVQIAPGKQAQLILEAIDQYGEHLLLGAIVNITYHRKRLRSIQGPGSE